jgi:hypothetical protein
MSNPATHPCIEKEEIWRRAEKSLLCGIGMPQEVRAGDRRYANY